jgi:hypothetical protein
MKTRPNSLDPHQWVETLPEIARVAGVSEATLKNRPYLNEFRREPQPRVSGPYGKPIWRTLPNTAQFLEDRYLETQQPRLHDVRAAAGYLGGIAPRGFTTCSTPF